MKDVIIKPLITEKSLKDARSGKFTFQVAKNAQKGAIKNAIQDAFKVNVIDVATMYVKGRTMRIGARRNEVKLSSWKKAVATLKAGEKIDMFDIGA